MLPDRGPDGNTVIVDAPGGLIVIDTGRHPWHSDGIIAFAKAQGKSVAAIVNTHWHLDHASGNRRVKAAYPGARVYTTTAVNQAVAPGGFLARNLAAAREAPVAADMPATRREERELFIATMDAADALRPDVAVDRLGPLALAGRTLDVRVTKDAVTAADVQKMLKERPKITGIAVPGMPMGSPGMEQGSAKDPYDTVAFTKGGAKTVFVKHR